MCTLSKDIGRDSLSNGCWCWPVAEVDDDERAVADDDEVVDIVLLWCWGADDAFKLVVDGGQ